MILHCDFETCNHLDLRKVGADVYSRSPTLIVTVLAWAFDDDPVESVTLPPALPDPVKHHLAGGGAFKAWNAAFEEAILRNHYGLPLAFDQAVCTMQAALHSGLPAKLEDAGPAIGARVHKDATAHRLMMQMASPRDPAVPTYWHADPGKLFDLRLYCERDVEAERAIGGMIADLPPRERRLAAIDRQANRAGVKLDLALVHRLRELARDETKRLNQESTQLTNGAVTSPGTQTAKLLDWLLRRGWQLPDVSKEAVAEAIAYAHPNGIPRDVLRVLNIRQEAAKSSVKKLDAMLRCAGPGDRVRGQLAYYGAGRTGRWAGRLIQPQNFPRPLSGIKIGEFITAVIAGATPAWFEQVFPTSVMSLVAAALRGCLVPAVHKAFVAYDLAQIEARILAWLAGQDDVLEVFAAGTIDVYVWTQRELGLPDRQSGKVCRLALGYQMGPHKLMDAAKGYGLRLSFSEAEAYVLAFRLKSPHIVDLWHRADNVAKNLLRFSQSQRTSLSCPIDRDERLWLELNIARNGKLLLTMLLPSGRRLYYRNARLGRDDQNRDTILYDGVDPYTKRWGTLKTYGGKLIENATQAVARDIMAEGLLNASTMAGDHELVLSVHDEAIFEVPFAEAGSYSPKIHAAMERMPDWADGLPVKAEGGVMHRYGK